MVVPRDFSEMASRRMACSMRPSRTVTAPTPCSTAWMQLRVLGIMPPAMRPLSISSRARLTSIRAMRVDWFWLSTRMPSVSVRKTSLSAFTASATARAASSALQLQAPPSSPREMGETTGRKPASSRVWRRVGSTLEMAPTRPRAGSFCRAVMRPPSRPETPQALAPILSRAATTALLTLAERAISAVSSTASSVTR